MKSKVVEIIFKSKVYAHKIDFKVKLECDHITWLWGYNGNPMNTEQDCIKCSKSDPHKLEILK